MIGKILLCCLLAITVATPAPADRKCFPSQWEAVQIGRIAQVYKNMPEVFAVQTNISDDYTNKMVAVHEVIQIKVKDAPDQYTYIAGVADYNKMMVYEFRPQTKTCKKTKLTMGIDRLCSNSPFAKLSHSFMLDGKMVDLYDTEKMVLGKKVKAFFSVFRDSFTPISEVVEQEYEGIPQMIAYQYGNVTTGIKDNSVFDVPDYCN